MNCRKQKKVFSGWKLILGGLLAVFLLTGAGKGTAYAAVYEGAVNPSAAYSEGDYCVLFEQGDTRAVLGPNNRYFIAGLSRTEVYCYRGGRWVDCTDRLHYDWYKLNESTDQFDPLENTNLNPQYYEIWLGNEGTYRNTVTLLDDDEKESVYANSFYWNVSTDFNPDSLEAGKAARSLTLINIIK